MPSGGANRRAHTGDRKLSPSSARDSLQGNLSMPATDAGLTLKKKKSWMASMRDAVSRTALTAKAAVDALRNDQSKAEATANSETTPPSFEPRVSVESNTSGKAQTISSTTSTRPKHDRQRSLASKFTTASLRQHLHSKRGSVYSIHTTPSGDSQEDIDGPETFTTPPLRPQDEGMLSSITGSIVGSIRGMRHKHKLSKSLTTQPVAIDPLSDDTQAPSSPNHIPSIAPALANLDFGATNLNVLPPVTVGSSGQKSEGMLSKLARLDQPLVRRPSNASVTHASFDEHGYVPAIIEHRPKAPRDLLNLRFEDRLPDLSLTPGPGTPMPGTNFALEIDGASPGQTKVFERSVTPPNKTEHNKLRAMRSIDAMTTELAAIWSVQESAHGSCSSFTEPDVEALPAPVKVWTTRLPANEIEDVTPTTLKLPAQRRNLASAETVHTLPPDMTELTRQNAAHTPEDEIIQQEAKDPFDDENAIVTGPPTPGESRKLPLRLKHVSTAGSTRRAYVDSNTHDYSHTTHDAAEEDGEIDPNAEYRFLSSSPLLPVDSVGSLQAQMEWQRDYVNATYDIETEPIIARRSTSYQTDPFVNSGSEDDTTRRAQELLTSDIVLPNYDTYDSASEDDLSAHGGPLNTTLAPQDVSITQDASPRSIRSRSTHTAGLGDAQYVFSFDSWLRESSGAVSPDAPATPNHRRAEMLSLDSVSTNGERTTPAISPSTTDPDHRTPSMGNKLELDLKRSNRNMRYNALYQENTTPATGDAGTVFTPKRHERSPFIIGGSENTEAAGLHFASFANAYSGSRGNSPSKDTATNEGTMSTRVGSEESVVAAIRNAALDYTQLEEQLEEIVDNVFADPVHQTRTKPHDDPFHTGPSSPARKPTSNSGIHYRFSTDSLISSHSITAQRSQHRALSKDSLDDAIKFFSSPDSGYQADGSSIAEPSSAGRAHPENHMDKEREGEEKGERVSSGEKGCGVERHWC